VPPETSRDFCWPKDDYVAAVAEAMRSAERILTPRPLTEGEGRDYPNAGEDRMINIGHTDLTLLSFNDCLARFCALHGPRSRTADPSSQPLNWDGSRRLPFKIVGSERGRRHGSGAKPPHDPASALDWGMRGNGTKVEGYRWSPGVAICVEC